MFIWVIILVLFCGSGEVGDWPKIGMGKQNGARAKAHRLRLAAAKAAGVSTPIRICYWNCNGVASLCKQQEIADAMEGGQIDLLFVDETHLKRGSNEDMTLIDPWNPIYLERGMGLKKGGGKLVLRSERLNCLVWNPEVEGSEWISSERVWILVHNNNCKIAICSVYMAAEVTANNEYIAWNDCIYEALQGEVRSRTEDGYLCMIIGDMNAHVGTPPDGIEGNRPGTNTNGEKLLNFVRNNNLLMLNQDKELCSGLFTRITPLSSTVLDYVLVSRALKNSVARMIIDEQLQWFSGSDHVAVYVEVILPDNKEHIELPKKKGLFLKKDRDIGLAHRIMDRHINEIDWDSLPLDEKLVNVQQILVSSNVEAYGTRQAKGVKHKNRKLKRLQQERRRVAQVERRLSVAKINKMLNGIVWDECDQTLLAKAVTENADLGDEIRKQRMVIQDRLAKSGRLKDSYTSDRFWRLAKRVTKNKGLFSALKAPDGRLVTEFNELKDLVVTELAKMSLGMKSKIFTTRGEQLVKEVRVKSATNNEKWIPKEREEFAYEEEVCCPTNEGEVREVIRSVKLDRAEGVDNVSSAMLKGASPTMITLITGIINESLMEGKVPGALQTGKMTLIDKKEPSLEVSKKRPITVSSVMLSIITKIIHKRMNKICEREGFYGSVQYGFRQKRSTTDCVLMILAALRVAKRKKQCISLAFCDIAKAYDSVCRELLYTKLRHIGFGGRVVSLIRSMYYNDCVRVNLSRGLSDPVYFTQGVKQGCSLSPMLFALFIASLGVALDSTKLGVELGGTVLTALFFADDLLLLSRTPKHGMNSLLRIVSQFCKDMKMTLSTSKTYILTNSRNQGFWKVEEETIEEILIAKYLGVSIQVRGRSMVGKYESDVIRRATNCAFSIMNLTRGSMDRSLVARRLWEACAIPSILYCSEAMVFTRKTLAELERIQCMVGRFILQVPASTSRVLVWCDAGLMPMEHRIQCRQALLIWNICKEKNNDKLLAVLRHLLDAQGDPWVKSWMKIQRDIGLIMEYDRKHVLVKAMADRAVKYVLSVLRTQPTMATLPQPWIWFKPQPHVTDSKASKTLNMVRGGNALLGNRYKNRYGARHVWCPLCKVMGVRVKLTESHVILSCPALCSLRLKLKITMFRTKAKLKGLRSNCEILKAYLGGDGSGKAELIDRGRKMAVILEAWLSASEPYGQENVL